MFSKCNWYRNKYIVSDDEPTMSNNGGIYASYKSKVALEYLSDDTYFELEKGDGCLFLIGGMENVVMHEHGFRASHVLPIAVIESNFSNLGAWYFGINILTLGEAELMVKETKKHFKNYNAETVAYSW